ncbi:MAG TPA: sulfotransferase domain-containing protein [Rhodanobacteraceae bacterium]|nr:sulfotransferase domain-containing protein [Rhodanobacteraceae bacterium]
MPPKPDFFIAGGMKCGTTALAQYLGAHPSVFIPRIKETNFFCSDLRTKGDVSTLAEYQGLYASVPAQRLCGDASARYLYSSVAIERLMQHNPRAKVITLLRYPVDAAYSLYAARWARGHENAGDFEQAWRLQSDRLAGSHMPPRWPDAITLQYGAIFRYAEQVRRVLELVPEPQRLFIVYEEFFADPAANYLRVLEFLGLPDAGQVEFPIVNAAVGSRYRRLDSLLRYPPAWLVALYRPLRPLLRAAGVSPANALRSLNLAPRPKPPLRTEFRAELDRFFADDIAELERLLGRPLWRAACKRDVAN